MARFHVHQVVQIPLLLNEVATRGRVKSQQVLEQLELLVAVVAVWLMRIFLSIWEGKKVDDGLPVPLVEVFFVLLRDRSLLEQFSSIEWYFPVG